MWEILLPNQNVFVDASLCRSYSRRPLRSRDIDTHKVSRQCVIADEFSDSRDARKPWCIRQTVNENLSRKIIIKMRELCAREHSRARFSVSGGLSRFLNLNILMV